MTVREGNHQSKRAEAAFEKGPVANSVELVNCGDYCFAAD